MSKHGVFFSFEDLEKVVVSIYISGFISLFPQFLSAAGLSDGGL